MTWKSQKENPLAYWVKSGRERDIFRIRVGGNKRGRDGYGGGPLAGADWKATTPTEVGLDLSGGIKPPIGTAGGSYE